MTRHIGILKSAGASIMVTIPRRRRLRGCCARRSSRCALVLVPADFGSPAAGFNAVRGAGGQIGFLQYTSGSTGNRKRGADPRQLLANVKPWQSGARHHRGRVRELAAALPRHGLIGGCFATMYLGFPVVLMSPLAFLSRRANGCAPSIATAAHFGRPQLLYELCLRRIPDEELEGLDLASWRFAFNGPSRLSADTLARSSKDSPGGISEKRDFAGLRPGGSLGRLAFTPPGEPWQVDLIDRDWLSRTGEAVPARPSDPRRSSGGLRSLDSRPRSAGGRRRRSRASRPQRRSTAVPRPVGDQRLLPQSRGDEGTVRRRMGEHGDRAYLSEGNLYITGREKDVIIRGGRNISPYELEEAVGGLAGVRRGCVRCLAAWTRRAGPTRGGARRDARGRPFAPRRDKRKINELAVSLIGAPVDDIMLARRIRCPRLRAANPPARRARLLRRGPSA